MTNVQDEAKHLIQKAKATAEALAEKSRKSLTSNIHLTHFDNLIQAYATQINNTIEGRVAKDLADLPDDIQASKAFNFLEGSLESTAYFLTSCLNNHERVPREIYYVTDWFLERCPLGSAEDIRYIATLYSGLAMIEFQEIMVGYNFEFIYPELFDSLKNNRFYFILLPPEFCNRSASLTWPLIFHEMGHAVDHHFCMARKIHSALPQSTSKLLQLANRGLEQAREKLWAQEYTSDYLAVLIAGPAFAWQFFRDYGRISTIMESSITHPATKTRMGNVTKLLRDQGFGGYAEKTEELVSKVSSSGEETKSATFLASAEMQKVLQFYKEKCKAFTGRQLEEFLKEMGKRSKELVTELLDMRPVICPPSLLYTLLSFEARDISGQKFQELLADCLRQYSVAEQFRSIVK